MPDAVWDHVVRGRWNVLCLMCFDEEAQIQGIRFTWDAVRLYPVSWSSWGDP